MSNDENGIYLGWLRILLICFHSTYIVILMKRESLAAVFGLVPQRRILTSQNEISRIRADNKLLKYENWIEMEYTE